MGDRNDANFARAYQAITPHLQEEVKEFAKFLLERRAKKFGRKLRQDWAGALKEYRFHSIALVLSKLEKSEALMRFVRDPLLREPLPLFTLNLGTRSTCPCDAGIWLGL